MKTVHKQILLTFFAVIGCAVTFFCISFLMLHEKSETTNIVESQIHYTGSIAPKGLLFNFEDGNSVFFNFDNQQNAVMIAILPHASDSETVKTYGYTVFKSLKTDHKMLEGFIDLIGGIEYENMRYTGVQITELLKHSADIQLRREVVSSIFKKIASNGLKSEDLVFLIENSQTDFSFPDGYSLLGNIQSLAANIHFIN